LGPQEAKGPSRMRPSARLAGFAASWEQEQEQEAGSQAGQDRGRGDCSWSCGLVVLMTEAAGRAIGPDLPGTSDCRGGQQPVGGLESGS
jgi:hypothetical protein